MESIQITLHLYEFEFEFSVFNATFSNISAISWRPISVVEKARVIGENHRTWSSSIYTKYELSCNQYHNHQFKCLMFLQQQLNTIKITYMKLLFHSTYICDMVVE